MRSFARPLLAALSLFFSPGIAAREIVVGVTPLDATRTELFAVDLDADVEGPAAPRRLGEVTHRAGHAPTGVVLHGHRLALVLAVGNAADALLVEKDLATGVERPLLDELVPTQAPLVWRRPDGTRELLAVRLRDEQRGGGHFDVTGVDTASGQTVVRASGARLWVTPFRGPAQGLAPSYLVVDGGPGFQGPVAVNVPDRTGDGHAHVDVVIDGTFVTQHRLGPGRFHSPVRVGERRLIERAGTGKSATLVDVVTGKVLLRGQAGMSPVAGDDGLVAVSSSKKDGSVLVGRLDDAWQTWPSGRSGVARPQLVLGDDDGDGGHDDVVVAWLDRGASLPGELWRVGKTARGLWPATPQTAVTVLGVLPSAKATPTPATNATPTPATKAPATKPDTTSPMSPETTGAGGH